MVKNELTQKNKLFNLKCSSTSQFCHGTIWFWK